MLKFQIQLIAPYTVKTAVFWDMMPYKLVVLLVLEEPVASIIPAEEWRHLAL
jgi:hypothetical protein